MAFECLRLWCLAFAFLLWAPGTQSDAIKKDPIGDALIQMYRMLQESKKLQDKQLYKMNDIESQLKSMKTELDKRYEEVKPLIGIISKMDERLSNVETILQKEDRHDSVQNTTEFVSSWSKTNESFEDIKQSIQKLVTTIENLKTNNAPKIEIENTLSANDYIMEKRFDETESKIDKVEHEIESLKNSFNKNPANSTCSEAASDMKLFAKHITDAEKLLIEYELKLNKYNVTKVSDESCQNEMHKEMASQGMEITKIQKQLSVAEEMLKQLPKFSDMQAGTNQTIQTLEAIVQWESNNTETKIASQGREFTKIQNQLLEAKEMLKQLPKFSDMEAGTNQTMKALINGISENTEAKMASQGKAIEKMQKQLSHAEQVLKQLPKLTDLQASTKQTMENLEAIVKGKSNNTEAMIASQGKEFTKIQNQLLEAKEMLKQLPKVSDMEAGTNQTMEALINGISENTEAKIARQCKDITKIQKLLSDADVIFKQLPKLSDLQADTNQTIETMETIVKGESRNTEAKIENQGKEITKIQKQLSNAEEMLKNKELPRLSDIPDTANRTTAAISNNTEAKTVCQCKEIIKIQKQLSDAEEVLKQLPKLTDLQASTKQTMETLEAIVKGESNNTEAKITSQGQEFTKIQKQLSVAEEMLKQLPKVSDMEAGTNQTMEALINGISEKTQAKITSQAKEFTKIQNQLSVAEEMMKLLPKLSDMETATNQTMEVIINNISENTEIATQGKEFTKIQNQLLEAKKMLNQLPKLSDMEAGTNQTQTLINSIAENTQAKIASQGMEFTKIQTQLSVTEEMLKQLPKFSDMEAGTNQTMEALINGISENTEAKIASLGKEFTKIQNQLLEAKEMLTQLPKFSDMEAGTNQTIEALINGISENTEAKIARQGQEFTKIQKQLSVAEEMLKLLPKFSDMEASRNKSMESLINGISENTEATVLTLATKLQELNDSLVASNKDMQETLSQCNSLPKSAYTNISQSYDTLYDEIQSLMKNETNVVSTTKSLVSNGIKQILLREVKQQNISTNIMDRVNALEASIMENQFLSYLNLSSKIETEMSQVWRQINVMNEQLKASKEALNKLNDSAASLSISSSRLRRSSDGLLPESPMDVQEAHDNTDADPETDENSTADKNIIKID